MLEKFHQTDMRLMKTYHNKIQLHLHNVNFFAVKILQEKPNTYEIEESPLDLDKNWTTEKKYIIEVVGK